MKKIKNVAGIWTMFRTASSMLYDKHNLDDFKVGYARYFGCGNHLYVLVKNHHDNEQRIVEIGNQNGIHSKDIAKQLLPVVKEFRVIMIDVEIGGMSVYSSEDNYKQQTQR